MSVTADRQGFFNRWVGNGEYVNPLKATIPEIEPEPDSWDVQDDAVQAQGFKLSELVEDVELSREMTKETAEKDYVPMTELPLALKVRATEATIAKSWLDVYAKRIGAGSYAFVYAAPNDPDKVIKISKPEVYDSWPIYASEIYNGRIKSKHAPKIYDVWVRGGYYVALMERLDRLRPDNREDHKLSTEAIHHFNDPRKIGKGSLKKFLTRLYNTWSHVFSFDVHEDNIMRRPETDEYVVTDPII